MSDEEKALTVLNNAERGDIQSVAQLFAESGYFPDVKSMAQAFVKIRTGRELGISAMAAMTGINIIQGKPVAGAHIIAAKVKMSGYDYRVKRLDNTGCEIDFYSKGGGILGTSSFTEEDAKKIVTTDKYGNEKRLIEKDNWKNYPRNMYFARAMSNGQRWFCPDATQGQLVYTPDELGGKVNADGDPLTGKDGRIVMDAEVVEEHTETLDELLPDAPPDIPEPPETVSPDELDREVDIKKAYFHIDAIAKAEGKSRSAVTLELSSFEDKKKKEWVAGVSDLTDERLWKRGDKWFNSIKSKAKKRHNEIKDTEANDELPF